MPLNNATLRPGILVSLKTKIRGNVSYAKRVVEEPHKLADGQLKEVTETTRVVFDPEELERAKVARNRASTLVRGVCAASDFGLLCPQAREADLEKAIAEARKVADTFNATAKLSRVGVFVVTGRVADNDVEAVRAINYEISGLLETMAEGVQKLDVKAIREAADKANSLGRMLTDDAAERIKGAITVARKVAREITKAGETAGQAVDEIALKRITEARLGFLEMDDLGAVDVTMEETAPAVDFEIPDDAPSATADVTVPALEMEEGN